MDRQIDGWMDGGMNHLGDPPSDSDCPYRATLRPPSCHVAVVIIKIIL